MPASARRLIADVRAYLKLMNRVSGPIAKERSLTITAENADDARAPVADLWLNLERRSLHFFNPGKHTIAYTFTREPNPTVSYSYRFTQQDERRFARPDGDDPFVIRYDRRLRARYFEEALAEEKARHLLRLFEAEQHFLRSMRRLRSLDRARTTVKAAGHRVGKRGIKDRHLVETMNVMGATALEAALRDVLLAQHDHWFAHLAEDERQAASAHVIRKLRLSEEFLGDVADGTTAMAGAIPWLANKLGTAREEIGPVNFQDLKSSKGVKWMYGALLDLDLVNLEVGWPDHWARLTDLMKRRHRIVHGGRTDSVPLQRIEDELETMRYFENGLMLSLLERAARDKNAPI